MEENKDKVQEISSEEIAETIDKYIMGEPIQKEYHIIKSRGISIVFQVPLSGMMDAATVALYQSKDPTKAMIDNSSNLIGLMMASYNGKNFVKEQGANYNTIEGVVERMKYIQDTVIVPIMDIIIERCKEFNEWYKAIFTQENLENF